MEKDKELEATQRSLPEETTHDDVYDGLLRDIVSREIAGRESREEGQTVVVEPLPGGESVVIGKRADLNHFFEFLKQGKTSYKEVEVGPFPTVPEKQEKVRRMLLPRLSLARERLGLPSLPVLGDLVGGLLEAGEDMAEKAGLQLEEKQKGGEGTVTREDLDRSFKGFEATFNEDAKED